MTQPIDLDELEAKRKAGTRERWENEDFPLNDGISVGIDSGAYGTFFAEFETQEDADLACAAVNALQPLVGRIRELETLVEKASSIIAASDTITMERWKHWRGEIEDQP